MWIVNALSIVCSEMLRLSRNNQTIKMFGVPPNTLPLAMYIGIFCYWVLLHYNMSFKTIAGGFNGAFWWYGPLSDALEHFLTNLPKLSCGFKKRKKILVQKFGLHIVSHYLTGWKWDLKLSLEVQWNLVIKRSDITKPSYNKVILLVPTLYISLFFYPDIMRNLI